MSGFAIQRVQWRLAINKTFQYIDVSYNWNLYTVQTSYIAITMLIALSQQSCMGSAHYYGAPSGTVEYGSGPTPVNPDKFRVDVDSYPTYEVADELVPPNSEDCSYGNCEQLPHVPITKGDQWQVTHIFNNLYIIESESYFKRQCNYLAKRKIWGFGGMLGSCSGTYDFGIYITPNGTVSGGWALLPGSRTLFSERQTYLNPNPKFNAGWPSGIVFVPRQHKQAE